MKITGCSIELTFNLGNYESRKVRFDAALSESDKPLEVTRDLEMLAHQHNENMLKPKPAPVQPAVKPTPQAPAVDPKTVCPKCGKPKKPQYELCYFCHEEATQR